MKRFCLTIVFLLTLVSGYSQVTVDANRDPLAARIDGSSTQNFAAASLTVSGPASFSYFTGNASDTLAAVSSTAKAGLDVWNGGPSMLLGGELGVNTRANGANKYGHILMVPNNTAARPWLPMRLYSSGTNNAITFGGGNGLYNSATLLDFNTGANVTTLTGTTRMEINARGAVLIASTTDDGVNVLQVNGPASMMTVNGLKMSASSISANTVDGADNSYISLNGGGGDSSIARGGLIILQGNEQTGKGDVGIYGGNSTSGAIKLFSGAAGTERMRVASTGEVLIATSTTDGVNALIVNGPASFANSLSVDSTSRMVAASGTNRFFGGAGNATLIGAGNTGAGASALTLLTSGTNNCAFGFEALKTIVGVNQSTAVGAYALRLSTAANGTAVGYNALNGNSTGVDNLGLGVAAGYQNTTGARNIFIGTLAGSAINAGTANTTSSGSIFVGYDTRASAAGVANEIVIGNYTSGNGANSVTIGNASVTITVLRAGTCIATNTPMTGYDLTVASGAWFGHDVSAETFTDRSAAPDTLAQAYEIVNSHESKNGKVDHSKLSSLAYGTKSRIVPTGRMISKTIKTTEEIPLKEREAVEDGKEPVTAREVETVVEEPETIVETVPDPSGRNVSACLSAAMLTIADLEKRIKILEAK